MQHQTSSVNLLPLLPSKLASVAGVTLLLAGLNCVMRGAFWPGSGVSVFLWIGNVGLVGEVFSDSALVGLIAYGGCTLACRAGPGMITSFAPNSLFGSSKGEPPAP